MRHRLFGYVDLVSAHCAYCASCLHFLIPHVAFSFLPSPNRPSSANSASFRRAIQFRAYARAPVSGAGETIVPEMRHQHSAFMKSPVGAHEYILNEDDDLDEDADEEDDDRFSWED